VIVLDTHALLWSQRDPKQLGKKALSLIERLWGAGAVCVSAITFWELGQLEERKRVNLSVSMRTWRIALLNSGLIELPLNGEIALRSLDFLALHADPADRFIAATALVHDASLMTADEKLLDWHHELKRHDARL